MYYSLFLFLISYQGLENPSKVKVQFGEDIYIYLDTITNKIDDKSEYARYQVLSDREVITVAEYILDTTIISNNACSKNGPLYKGDVAYFFLLYSGSLHDIADKGPHFDSFRMNCYTPEGLLDWLDDNREAVQRKILEVKMR